jgi:hypothetical protein
MADKLNELIEIFNSLLREYDAPAQEIIPEGDVDAERPGVMYLTLEAGDALTRAVNTVQRAIAIRDARKEKRDRA